MPAHNLSATYIYVAVRLTQRLDATHEVHKRGTAKHKGSGINGLLISRLVLDTPCPKCIESSRIAPSCYKELQSRGLLDLIILLPYLHVVNNGLLLGFLVRWIEWDGLIGYPRSYAFEPNLFEVTWNQSAK